MFNVIQRLLGGDIPPNRVQEVKSDVYGTLQVLHRDDALVLYAPPSITTDKKIIYEIVLHRPFKDTLNTSYSVYRSPTLPDAEEKFTALCQRLPVIVSLAKEMYNINGVQRIADALIENPSWSIAHLVAYFNLIEHTGNQRILNMIDYPDHANLMTPLQLAIKASNIDMVKLLLPLSKIDHLDNNSNSVYHYASITTKEMINLLTATSTANLNHCNLDGYTPLHLACLSDKPECVKSLLLAGADVNISARNIHNRNNVTSSCVADFMQFNTNKLFTQDMKHGGTPLHWSSSREVIHELIECGCDVNARNFQGQTALHVMVTRNRLDCVVALLSHEAEIDIKDDDGNTPLHIAVEKKFVPMVQCLVVFGCDFNMENYENKTPRHMVGKDASGGSDDMILYILHSVGAKRCGPMNTKCPPGCNATGSYNGIPPAQPESGEQREHIHQVLASNTKTNRTTSISNTIINSILSNSTSPTSIESPTSLAVTTQPGTTLVDLAPEQRGQSIMDAILGMFTGKIKANSNVPISNSSSSTKISGIEMDIENQSTTSTKPTEKHPGGRLLCLDGGGIRGVILVQMLLEIEKLSQIPVAHLFDWIAGTSTGGILALALGTGKTMKQCMCLYLRMKDKTFVGSRPYESSNLEQLLKDNLGEFTVMSDIQHPKIMVTGVMADRKPVNLHLFRNYTCASDILGIVTPASNRKNPPLRPEDQLVWRAARATGAAPSYFRVFERFLDGGLIANNPTLDAMTEIHEYNMALKSVNRESEATPLSIVVSLGTGLVPVTEIKEIDVFRPDSIWDTAKLAYGISALGNLLVDQATASDGRVVDRARAWCSMIGIPYFRFNPQMSVDIAMDEKNDQKLINILWETKAYMYTNRNKVIEMINLLK